MISIRSMLISALGAAFVLPGVPAVAQNALYKKTERG